ncbi:MAG: GDSL-type esterase/lipase family protein [Ignavibacteria bacterium]
MKKRKANVRNEKRKIKGNPQSRIEKLPPDTERKKIPKIFYLTAILIPVIFFTLLEIFLRVFNYGINTEQWFAITENKLMLNPEIARRYFFNIEKVPYSNEDLFDKIKAKNSFRIFVLGESSAAGYPYLPIGSFSRYLEKRLELLYPDSRIEVVNLAMTAINTYALRDLFPEIIEQKPDLVLIYTGHNEYYGALGVGSTESFGSSTSLVNAILYLNKFKSFELIRNSINSAAQLFSGKQKRDPGTLMSRIVKEQYIPFGGQNYRNGLNQFKNNIEDILAVAAENSIPVILGTLTSNLKDQPPFISIKSKNMPGAMEVFNLAKAELADGNIPAAVKLFKKAKDLDCLRFRAPEEINDLIRKLGAEYRCPVVDVDSLFNAISPHGITGNNLMTDHLHPTLEGYQLIAKLYLEQMKKSNFLPKARLLNFEEKLLDSLTNTLNKFTRLDSLIAINRIKILKNDWPYIKRKDKKPVESIIQRKSFIDSLAAEVVFEEITWEKAHREAAQWHLNRGEIPEFQNYVDVLTEQYPIIIEYYQFTANILIEKKKYDEAYKYLLKGYEIKRDAFFSKWLGIIDLSKGKTDNAIKYLEESMMEIKDAQVLYNLSGAYAYKKDFKKAFELITLCIQINPLFPEAQELSNQLRAASKN